MSRASTVIASPTTATPGAAFGGVPSAAIPLQPAAARGSVTAPMASTRRRVASRAIMHLPLYGRPRYPGRPSGRRRSVAAGLPACHAREPSPAGQLSRADRAAIPGRGALSRPVRGKTGTSGVDQVNLPSGSGYASSWQLAAQIAGEEVVMHGDSRHAQSRPRRGYGRSSDGAGSERARAAGPLPEPADLARVLEPVVRAAGMDLESVRVSPAGRRRLLKLVVDADGGAALDQIAEVSREVSVRLDASGVMGEIPYTLEVSSPGEDRPLTEPRHWRRAQGRLVSAPLAVGGADNYGQTGARRPPTVRGRILAAGDTSVTLDVEGDRVELDYVELGPGRVQVEFGRADAGAGPVLDRAQAGNGGSQDGH